MTGDILYKDNGTSNKGYRYEALLQAIDFFTQRFSLEQISEYAFEFTNEILTLHSSALFIHEKEGYVLKKSRLYAIDNYTIPSSKELDELPVLHGDIVVHHLKNYFSEESIKDFDIKMVIPLIIEDYLYGFIVSNGKTLSSFDEDDKIIASTLTKLYANSLGNSRQLAELALKNKQLDQKIFNLFATNQSAKSLLSEVDLNKLYTLATDIFSEITCSKVTSFGAYDAAGKCIKVLGYRNVTNYSTVFTEFQLNKHTYRGESIVLDFEKDLKLIQNLFKNWQEFYLLDTKYIVLLVKDEILGVVTLSEAVNDRLYDEATFELIETLASFTHIAISNALLFKELIAEHERTERKFNILDTLNKIIQNINRGSSIEELSMLTLKVLSLNFGVKKAFFAYREEQSYTVKCTLGLGVQNAAFELKQGWDKITQGEMLLDFREKALHDYFEEALIDQIGSSNCLVLSPLCSSALCDYDEIKPNGFLVVTETQSSLKEEEILLIDTIAKNISPVICQMILNQYLKEEYQIDPRRQLTKVLETKFEERESYGLEFYLRFKRIVMNPFKNQEDYFVVGEECYIVGSFLFVISYYEEMEDTDFCLAPRFDDLEDMLRFDYAVYYENYMNSLLDDVVPEA